MSVRNVPGNPVARGESRLAVVGASTPDGAGIRHALAVVGVSGSRVDLYGTAQGEALVSEYAGEARLIQEADLSEITEHDVIFLCETGELVESVVRVAGPRSVIIDLVGALATSKLRLIHMDVNPEITGEETRFAIPHPLATVIVEPLLALDRQFGIDDAVAVVLRPASDFGDSGVEELRDQTTRLLSFTAVPTEAFGRQLAFNILPQSLPEDSRDKSASDAIRVSEQVAELLGWDRSRLSVRLLTVPLFHGHGIQLRLSLKKDPGRDALVRLLTEKGWVQDTSTVSTPLEVCEESKTRAVEVEADGRGGYWLWLVVGELGTRGVEQAVRVAHAASEL